MKRIAYTITPYTTVIRLLGVVQNPANGFPAGSLAAVTARLAELDRFWEKEQTKAEIKVFILDGVFAGLPTPPFTTEDKEAVAADVYDHIWQQAISGEFAMAA